MSNTAVPNCLVHGQSCLKCGVALDMENSLLMKQLADAMDLLVDCWFQFSTYTDAKGVTKRSTGGLSTLEHLKRFLMEQMLIDEKGEPRDVGKEMSAQRE